MNSFAQKHHSSDGLLSGRRNNKFFQPKLTIHNPNDEYEKEADRMADKVMRMEQPGIQPKPLPITSIQRKCAHCEEEEKKMQRKEMNGVEATADSTLENYADNLMSTETKSFQTRPDNNLLFKPVPIAIKPIQRKCAHCEEEEKEMQRKEMNGGEATADNSLENYVGNLSSSGQPLPNEVRNFYEPRFGYDFSNVKVHTDSVAAKSAQSINALAYTSGNNIVFNSGQYSSQTDSGKRLLGHELTHVVQQDGNKTLLNKAIQLQAAPPAVPPPTLAGLTATRVAFNNARAPDPDNCSTILPAALGVDGPSVGQNGMEMIFRINGAIPAGTEFDILRTRSAGLWEQNAGAWNRLGGNPAGTNDDHHNDDECLTPVGRRIFVFDRPGLGGSLNPRGVAFLGAGRVGAAATSAIWILSFAEWVIARNRTLGIGWTTISSPTLHRWHSILSTALVGGVWTRVNTPGGLHNEIELGHVATTGPMP